MNKAQIVGLIILLLSLAAYFFMNIEGFWIGASTGIGAGLLIIGKLKKV
ncbi:MAG: hypothetical protein V7691_00165 [Galbibacter orientalis]